MKQKPYTVFQKMFLLKKQRFSRMFFATIIASAMMHLQYYIQPLAGLPVGSGEKQSH
jgi:hypothetical protein